MNHILRCDWLPEWARWWSSAAFRSVNKQKIKNKLRQGKGRLPVTCTCLCFRRVSYLLERVPSFTAASAPKRTSSDLNFLSSNILQREKKTEKRFMLNSSIPRNDRNHKQTVEENIMTKLLAKKHCLGVAPNSRKWQQRKYMAMIKRNQDFKRDTERVV